MPLIVHNHYHQYFDTSHHFRRVDGQLGEILTKLESLKGLLMLPKEVSDLIDQARKNNDVLKSMETHYNALAALVGSLQTTINNLPPNLTEADKAALVAQTSDLAAAFSQATDVITANTKLEGGADPSTQVQQPSAADLAAAQAQKAADAAAAAAAAQAQKDADAAAAAQADADGTKTSSTADKP